MDWNEVLHHIQTQATSGSARRIIQDLQPFELREEAQSSAEEIFRASTKWLLMEVPRPSLESLDLFEIWFSRIKKQAVLQTTELRDIRSFCLEALSLKEFFQVVDPKKETRWERDLMEINEPLSAIDHLITPAGEIRSDASETLYRLTREKESLVQQIEQTLDRLVKAHQMQTLLQDRYVTTREGRWVLPIKSGMQHAIKGTLHGASQTKQTVYIEPESVTPLNNRLHQVEVEIEIEIERLLIAISEYLSASHRVEEFDLTRKTMLEADVLLAKAQWTRLIQGSEFKFSEDNNEMHLMGVKHPLLTLHGRWVVPNTVQLFSSKTPILLLSGPNAGGKTVLLKSIGLAAQMSRCGLPICAAPGSILPFFKNIHIVMGDEQSVEAELSTFAAHLKALHRGSQLRGPENLILVDEICGATDPEEGAALARAFLEEYGHRRIFGVVTSHLGPLKSGWPPESPIVNGSLEYDPKTARPTYQFLPGIAGDSLAIPIAQRVGVSPQLIDRAKEFLTPISRERLSGMEEIRRMRDDIHLLSEHLRKETQKMEEEKKNYTLQILHLEKEKAKILEKLRSETEAKIEGLLQEARVIETFQRHRALQKIKMELPLVIPSKSPSALASASSPLTVVDSSTDASTPSTTPSVVTVPLASPLLSDSSIPTTTPSGTQPPFSPSPSSSSAPFGSHEKEPPTTAEAFAQRFPPGTKIFLTHLRQDGLIQSTPNAKGEVTVLSSTSLRLILPWQEIFSHLPTSNRRGAALTPSPSSAPSPSLLPSPQLPSTPTTANPAMALTSSTLDLRGRSVEEALEELDFAMDQLARGGENFRMKVIHGHGTEALKRAVRTHLSRSSYVKKWRVGTSDQGGDGVTLVELEEITYSGLKK